MPKRSDSLHLTKWYYSLPEDRKGKNAIGITMVDWKKTRQGTFPLIGNSVAILEVLSLF